MIGDAASAVISAASVIVPKYGVGTVAAPFLRLKDGQHPGS